MIWLTDCCQNATSVVICDWNFSWRSVGRLWESSTPRSGDKIRNLFWTKQNPPFHHVTECEHILYSLQKKGWEVSMLPCDLNRGFWLVQNKIQNFPPKVKYNCHSLPRVVTLKITVFSDMTPCNLVSLCQCWHSFIRLHVVRSQYAVAFVSFITFNGRWSKLGIQKRDSETMPYGSSHLTYAPRHTR